MEKKSPAHCALYSSHGSSLKHVEANLTEKKERGDGLREQMNIRASKA
jgi:hypothetical protein